MSEHPQVSLDQPPEEAHETLFRLAETIAARRGADPARSYVARLLSGPESGLLKKIIEEAGEVSLAAVSGDRRDIVYEVADLWFHTLVVLARHDLTPELVLAELRRREGTSGLAEKAARRSHP